MKKEQLKADQILPDFSKENPLEPEQPAVPYEQWLHEIAEIESDLSIFLSNTNGEGERDCRWKADEFDEMDEMIAEITEEEPQVQIEKTFEFNQQNGTAGFRITLTSRISSSARSHEIKYQDWPKPFEYVEQHTIIVCQAVAWGRRQLVFTKGEEIDVGKGKYTFLTKCKQAWRETPMEMKEKEYVLYLSKIIFIFMGQGKESE